MRFNKGAFSVYFIVLLNISSSLLGAQRHVVGAMPWGFFSNFLGVINHLDYCKKANLIPVVYWKKPFFCWQTEPFHGSNNAWEYYFEPVSSENYQPGDIVSNTYSAAPGEKYLPYLRCFSQEEREFAYGLIEEYIRVKPYVRDIVDTFFERYLHDCISIGIHLRGTDKKIEVKALAPEIIVDAALAEAKKFNDYVVKFFVASDEQRLIDLAVKRLQGYEVVIYPAYRSTNGRPIHADKNCKALRGLEVLVETLLFTRCSRFIHTVSNVSNAVLAFNPYLEHICLPR